MQYPKKIMRFSEMRDDLHFPNEVLVRAYREKGQTFAWKMNPLKSNSPIVFDTEGFERWRLKQVKISQQV